MKHLFSYISDSVENELKSNNLLENVANVVLLLEQGNNWSK